MLRRNVGGVDRAVRLALGLILLATGFFVLGPGDVLRWPALILGLMGLVSGTAGYCVLYVPFGLSTRRGGP
jgi:hypothetical protein